MGEDAAAVASRTLARFREILSQMRSQTLLVRRCSAEPWPNFGGEDLTYPPDLKPPLVRANLAAYEAVAFDATSFPESA